MAEAESQTQVHTVPENVEKAGKLAPELSKNQLKKQQRQLRWAETKKDRRKKEREKVKERKKKRMEELRSQGFDENIDIVKKKRMADPEASNIRVAIDCAYDDLMTEPDVKKLIKQIQRCYAENRKSEKPLQFYLSSLNNKTKQLMDTIIQGYQNWDVHLEAEGPRESFGADNIVYLAAESPNVLQDLVPDKVYIIGGLVDHNHHKGYCYEKVLEKGWSHAQLPIGDFVKLNSRKVLAVNHVYEIILAYVQLGDWREAFNQILPNRKVKEFVSKEDTDPDPRDSQPDSIEAEDDNSSSPHKNHEQESEEESAFISSERTQNEGNSPYDSVSCLHETKGDDCKLIGEDGAEELPMEVADIAEEHREVGDSPKDRISPGDATS